MGAHYAFAAVTNLVGRYCDAVARFDIEAFAALWAEDAIWYIAGGDDRHGRDAIVDLFRAARAPFELCIQETLSSVVDPAGHARWYVRELQWRKDGRRVQLLGVYDDTLTGPSDAPLFASRRFSVLYRGPTDLSGRLFGAPTIGPA
ncbi:MAG: nuclear transport factor 2 family protein [Deltaproteobacteria bacterium]|jgi:ketosteroid isomerase-like protein|nr:nuclear transport factor 2 family protein [Deltaproteobacteria bacterium]